MTIVRLDDPDLGPGAVFEVECIDDRLRCSPTWWWPRHRAEGPRALGHSAPALWAISPVVICQMDDLSCALASRR